MTKISCNIIQDILPLYQDEICSLDSRKMVEEHLLECDTCSHILEELKSEYTVNSKEKGENKKESTVLGQMALSWKRTLRKTLLIGISITSAILLFAFAAYYALFQYHGSMVACREVSITAYMYTEEQLSFRMETLDGYCGGTMDTYVDNNNNLYISIKRTVVKETLPKGETEIMEYGFNQAEKKYNAVYYGEPGDCFPIWEPGYNLPVNNLRLY